MADIPIGLPPPDAEQIPIIPGGPGQSFSQPLDLRGPQPPPTPAPPETPAESPTEGNHGGVSDLTLLATLLVALALALLAQYLSDFFNWMLRAAFGPFSGRRGVKQLDPTRVTQALSNAMGKAVTGIDGQMGTEFTKLSQTTGRMSGTLIRIGEMILQIAGAISGLEHHTAGLSQGQAQTRAQAKAATQAASAAQGRIATVQKQAHADSQSLHGQVAALTHHVTHVLEPELESLRDRIPKLEKGAVVTWDEIRKHDELLGIGAMTATVAVAMGRLGASWTRCETNQSIGKQLCGSNSDSIRKLLKGSLDLLGLIELCAIARELRFVVDNPVVVDGLGLFSSGISDLLRCTGATRASALNTPQVALAPPTAWAVLAPVTL